MEQSIIYVLAASGKPLMPTRRRNKVWYWLRRGLAKVVSREPFTIQLRFETAEYTQRVTVGVDTGSKTVGIAATTNGAVVYQAEVHLRADITDKLAQRRQYRRSRRSRKTRYRAARFANRRRPAGWLPPSLRSKAEATVKAVQFAARVLPVCQVNVEVGSFDTQKMQHPQISGLDYQQGELQGYLLREYLLEKWQHHCAYCGAQEVPLEVEHIVPRSRGGSNRVSNLTLACRPCNVRKGKQTAAEFGYPAIQAQARLPLQDAAHVSALKTAVVQRLQEIFGTDRVAVSYGYETKYQRIQVLGLPKSHTNDAVAIACAVGEVVEPCAAAHQLRCVPRGNYQLFNGKHSEHRVWAPRKVKGWKLYERVAAKGQVGYIWLKPRGTRAAKLMDARARRLRGMGGPGTIAAARRQSRATGTDSHPRSAGKQVKHLQHLQHLQHPRDTTALHRKHPMRKIMEIPSYSLHKSFMIVPVNTGRRFWHE